MKMLDKLKSMVGKGKMLGIRLICIKILQYHQCNADIAGDVSINND